MSIPLPEWLRVVRDEYLRDFIGRGGAAVKFAVPMDHPTHEDLWHSLHRIAREEGFVYAGVDAAMTKTHLVDQVFHAVARQIDWDELARSFISRLLEEHGYGLPGDGDNLSLRRIASQSGREETLFRREVYGWLERAIYRDYAMTQEFRIAMIRLCLGQLDPGSSPFLTAAIKDWLRGELALISALKQALIFQRIARHSARHMLCSLTHWLKVCGSGGLVLVIDISKYTAGRRPKVPDGTLYYSIPAVMDGHEVLRQFIDGTDELECCFLAIVASREFLSDFQRGIDCYDALRLRIADEVRDRIRANPLASVVRLVRNT